MCSHDLDRDIWAAALLMVKRYGDDAMLEAAARWHRLLEDGDMADAEVWHRILNAIERLPRKKERNREMRASIRNSMARLA